MIRVSRLSTAAVLVSFELLLRLNLTSSSPHPSDHITISPFVILAATSSSHCHKQQLIAPSPIASMEFSKLGRHCALESCHRLDWLPFQCNNCSLHYCLDHRTPTSHSCAATPTPPPEPSLILHSHINPHRCTAPHCRTREALPNTCRNCGNNFCLRHRFPTQHECTANVGRNVIRKQGELVPQSSSLLSPVREESVNGGTACAEEARKVERKRNTNVAQSRLLQQHAQKAH
jgi:predicted nucleic acid binding AN1-type Zn finger protein